MCLAHDRPVRLDDPSLGRQEDLQRRLNEQKDLRLQRPPLDNSEAEPVGEFRIVRCATDRPEDGSQ